MDKKRVQYLLMHIRVFFLFIYLFAQLRHAHCKTRCLEEAWGKKLEDYDGKPNYTSFEKQYGQITPPDVYLFFQQIVECACN